jgi:hypothetical protein
MPRITEQFTNGVLKALHKNKNRSVCKCGFPMPVYPGRYPSTCPSCGARREGAPTEPEAEPAAVEPEAS